LVTPTLFRFRIEIPVFIFAVNIIVTNVPGLEIFPEPRIRLKTPLMLPAVLSMVPGLKKVE